MQELIQKGLEFMNYASQWFNQNVGAGAGNFFKALLNLLVAVLMFIVDILRWVIGKI